MILPESLDEWTLETIQQLVDGEYHEDDQFDFKEALQGRNAEHNEQVVRAACSFANTRGGYLVFGVRDRSTGRERIVGVPESRENAKRVTDNLSLAEPSVGFSVQNPPIPVPGGKVVLVVEVPQSQRGPHWDRSRHFWKRSQGTAVEMTYKEIQDAFEPPRV